MLYKNRLIPIMQIESRRLVKTIRFSPKQYLGDPINAVRIFNLKEVNELVITDIGATKTHKIDFEFLKKLSAQAFIPLAYGGGVYSMDDVHHLFQIGFDRIIFGTSAITTPDFIKEVARIYGTQSIICSLDIKKNLWGKEGVTYSGGKKISRLTSKDCVQQFVESGAGEILLHDQSRDGTYQGLDKRLIQEISSYSHLPLMACGGTNHIEDALSGIKSGASAVGIGSLFSFYGAHKAVLINYGKSTSR
jgi:cyclase